MKWTFLGLIGMVIMLAFIRPISNTSMDLDKLSTGEVLIALGDTAIMKHLPDTTIAKVSAERGKQLVVDGQASKPGWGVTARISPYFECTSCHNLEAETASLTSLDPEERLEYTTQNGLPYLQGSPLFGLVSRLHFYNGDYQKKYGDLAKKAYSDIREAIQLCATECSQGRLLDKWELESVLAYFWTIDIPFSRLEMSEDEIRSVRQALEDPSLANNAIQTIQSKYITAYPATFIDPPPDRKKGNPYEGDMAKGELLYINSCLHCHADKRYSLYELDTSYMSLNQLARRMPTYHEESLYQVARYGTSPLRGKGAYMPNYTKEKLSRRQMADLRAYIFSKTNEP